MLHLVSEINSLFLFVNLLEVSLSLTHLFAPTTSSSVDSIAILLISNFLTLSLPS